MDEINIGNHIRKQREKKKLTQKQLGDAIGVTESCVQKWEKAKNMPPFPIIVSLTKFFNLSIEELCPELNIRKRGVDEMLENLKIYNQNAAKTIIYTGIEEVCAGYCSYHKDYSIISNYVFYEDDDIIKNDENDTSEWLLNNKFLFLLNKDTKEIYGIRDFGMHLPCGEDFIFSTNYIPFDMLPKSYTRKEIELAANNVYSIYEKELKKLENVKNEKLPLLIFDYLCSNHYIAWSIKENKCVYIYNYKKYRSNFGISDVDCSKTSDISFNHNYTVITPSKDFIEALGLILDPNIWEYKQSWDKWEKREPRKIIISKEQVSEPIYNTYIDAISLINTSREKNCGYDNDFATLERTTSSLERLVALNAPIIILENSESIMKKSIDNIRSLENRILNVIFGK